MHFNEFRITTKMHCDATAMDDVSVKSVPSVSVTIAPSVNGSIEALLVQSVNVFSDGRRCQKMRTLQSRCIAK